LIVAMKGSLQCIPCLIRQAVDISGRVFEKDQEQQQWIKETLKKLSDKDFLGVSPPEISASFYQDLIGRSGIPDPYKDIKLQFNQMILSMEKQLQLRIDSSEDPLREALILAITGNIIDFGTPHGVSEESVLRQIEASESSPLARDDSKILFQHLGRAKRLLYLGDNCGEIVFDKLFIKQLKQHFPDLHISYAVRGSAILNDVTEYDAEQIGMTGLVPVLSNGDFAPGTRLDKVSAPFLKEYKQADLLISKGQGNLETLDEEQNKDIYFLFMTKCALVSRKTKTPLHSLMCMKNS